MIRINLLPVRETRRQAGLRMQGMMLGAAVGAGALLCIGMHFSIKSQIAGQRRSIAVKTTELKKLEATQEEVRRFQAEQEEIQRKLSVITQIEKARTGPVRIMDDIAKSIPSRVWLRKMKAQGGTLSLQGQSLDPEIVADFADRLDASEMISNVELQETAVEETDGLKLNKFKLKAAYPHVKPEPAAADKQRGRRGQ